MVKVHPDPQTLFGTGIFTYHAYTLINALVNMPVPASSCLGEDERLHVEVDRNHKELLKKDRLKSGGSPNRFLGVFL